MKPGWARLLRDLVHFGTEVLRNLQGSGQMQPQAIHLENIKYRPDNDGLRAVAVLSVVGLEVAPRSWTGFLAF